MQQKHKTILLIWIWNMVACVALAVIIVPRIDSLSFRLTAQDVFYGDMYGLNKVDRFRFAVPKVDTPSEPSRKKAEAITIGDSFFGSHFEQPRFWYLFEQQTNIPTYHVDDIHAHISPSRVLLEQNAKKVKLVIWEEVERNIMGVYLGQHSKAPVDIVALFPSVLRSSQTFHFYEKIRNQIFDTKPMLFFIENSIFTSQFFEKLYSWRFSLTGNISPRTPEYSLDPPMVFFDAEVENARTAVSDEGVALMADRIEKEITTIKEQYGVETIYIPLPSKYTVYRKFLPDQSYNELLPRLISQLRARKIHVLDVLPVFESYTAQHDDLLYYSSDTHWRPPAVQMVLDMLKQALNEDSELVDSLGI